MKHNPSFAYKSNDGPKLAITTREGDFKDMRGSYIKYQHKYQCWIMIFFLKWKAMVWVTRKWILDRTKKMSLCHWVNSIMSIVNTKSVTERGRRNGKKEGNLARIILKQEGAFLERQNRLGLLTWWGPRWGSEKRSRNQRRVEEGG